MTTSLIDAIPEIDKRRIRNYLLKYGGLCSGVWQNDVKNNENYLNEWLCNWDKSKKKLYRLFGKSLILTERIQIPSNPEILYRRVKDLEEEKYKESYADYNNGKMLTSEGQLYPCSYFLDYFHTYDFMRDLLKQKRTLKDELNKLDINLDPAKNFYITINSEDNFDALRNMMHIFSREYSMTGICPVNVRVREVLPDDTFRLLKINKGEKIGKARAKVLDFFGYSNRFPLFKKQLDEYEKVCNEIRSQKSYSATLCLSIHPLDFITMSDNASGWSSCMNWTEDYNGGCYRVGTVEMMNSNMVVCAYLLPADEKAQKYFFGQYDHEYWADDDYFYEDVDKDSAFAEEWTWNNKRWRNLFYVSKDILCCGKAYPYCNDELNLLILDKLKTLAEKNLGWTYQFGPQPYGDMKKMSYKNYDKYRKKEIARDRHKIIFETKGMYNDFLNNPDYKHFYCYRNYVKKNKILCLSGEALSISNNVPFLRKELYDYECRRLEDYNDRYGENLNYLY